MLRLGLVLSLFLLVAGCVFVPRWMWTAAQQNQQHVNEIRIGQTPGEVRALMGRGPEKRDARLRYDGKTVEMWSYVTDYARKLDTTITFVDGHVEEIRATPWQEKD